MSNCFNQDYYSELRCRARMRAMAGYVVKNLHNVVKARDLEEALDLVSYQTDVSRQTVRKLIVGKTLPKISTLCRICAHNGLRLALAARPIGETGYYKHSHTSLDWRAPRAGVLRFARLISGKPEKDWPHHIEPTFKTIVRLAEKHGLELGLVVRPF